MLWISFRSWYLALKKKERVPRGQNEKEINVNPFRAVDSQTMSVSTKAKSHDCLTMSKSKLNSVSWSNIPPIMHSLSCIPEQDNIKSTKRRRCILINLTDHVLILTSLESTTSTVVVLNLTWVLVSETINWPSFK